MCTDARVSTRYWVRVWRSEYTYNSQSASVQVDVTALIPLRSNREQGSSGTPSASSRLPGMPYVFDIEHTRYVLISDTRVIMFEQCRWIWYVSGWRGKGCEIDRECFLLYCFVWDRLLVAAACGYPEIWRRGRFAVEQGTRIYITQPENKLICGRPVGQNHAEHSTVFVGVVAIKWLKRWTVGNLNVVLLALGLGPLVHDPGSTSNNKTLLQYVHVATDNNTRYPHKRMKQST